MELDAHKDEVCEPLAPAVGSAPGDGLLVCELLVDAPDVNVAPQEHHRIGEDDDEGRDHGLSREDDEPEDVDRKDETEPPADTLEDVAVCLLRRHKGHDDEACDECVNEAPDGEGKPCGSDLSGE